MCGQSGAARHPEIFQRAEKDVKNMVWWRVWGVIRTTEVIHHGFSLAAVEYDTFTVSHLISITSRKEALERAEIHFYKKYGIDVDVILVGATRIKF